MFKFFKSKVSPVTPLAPFDERDMVWGILRNDPKIMSHVWGAQIHSLQHVKQDDDAVHELINDIVENIVQRFADKPETLSRILRTMMVTYDIKINPTRVPSFDRIHSLISGYVWQNYRDIQVYQ